LLAVLLVVVPFAGAAPLTTLDIVVKVPEYSRQPTLTLEGTTKANIDVHMFVNAVRMRVVKSNSQGVFRLVNVPLTAATNAVRLEAHEGGSIAGKDHTVHPIDLLRETAAVHPFGGGPSPEVGYTQQLFCGIHNALTGQPVLFQPVGQGKLHVLQLLWRCQMLCRRVN